MKNKIKIHHASSIKEAIDDFQQFLECDLYTKFRPEQQFPTGKKGKIKKFYRQDVFPDEKEFLKYLDDHFNIFAEEVVKLIGKKELAKEKK